MPTFAYEFDDGTAPPIFAGPGFPPIATHSSEIQYLFDQPNAPYATPLNADQEALARSMRTAWTDFAANGNPSAAGVRWPSFTTRSAVLSLGVAATTARAELRPDTPLRVLGRRMIQLSGPSK